MTSHRIGLFVTPYILVRMYLGVLGYEFRENGGYIDGIAMITVGVKYAFAAVSLAIWTFLMSHQTSFRSYVLGGTLFYLLFFYLSQVAITAAFTPFSSFYDLLVLDSLLSFQYFAHFGIFGFFLCLTHWAVFLKLLCNN